MKIDVITDTAICLGVKLIFLDLKCLVFDNGCNTKISVSEGKVSVYINNHFYKEYILFFHNDVIAALEDLKKYFSNHLLDQR